MGYRDHSWCACLGSDFDGKNNDHYKVIWEKDKNNEDLSSFKVESLNEVKNRILNLIKNLERKHKDEKILLVSHGDVLQVILNNFSSLENNKNIDASLIKLAQLIKL